MSSSIDKKKHEFINFYIKDGLRVSSDPSYIISLSKYLMDVLRCNNLEIDKLASTTAETLQNLFNREKKPPDIEMKGFPLYKNPDGTMKHVDFFLENGKIINTYHSK